MDIGAADTAMTDLDEHFTVRNGGLWDSFYGEGIARLVEYGSFHNLVS
jgi:hypothetical protein